MTSLYVLGHIGSQQVAFEATSVDAVVDIALVVPVPLAAAHVVGLAAIRSQVITVIDGNVATGGPPGSPTGRAVVAEVDGHRYAIRVDRIDDVLGGALHAASDAMPLALAWRRLAKGLIQVDEGFAVIVDAAALIAGQPARIAA